MLESPAYRVLSLAARRVLDRLAIELAAHGGNDHDKLPVTFNQFRDYGIDRGAIAPATRELIALGFIEVTVQGRASAGSCRWPNAFSLPWVNCKSNPYPTCPWRRITTMEDATKIARMARKPRRRARVIPLRPVEGAAPEGRPRS